MWAYIFGAICPKKGKGAGLVLPYCDTDAVNQHLLEISQAVDDGAHAVLILDQAGWHVTPKLSVPDNITLLSLPPRSPELNLDGLADAIEMMRQSARLTSTYGNRVALFAGAGVFRMGEAVI